MVCAQFRPAVNPRHYITMYMHYKHEVLWVLACVCVCKVELSWDWCCYSKGDYVGTVIDERC